MSRRLSVLLAAFHEPRLLLLDEPFDGVDPLGVDATLEVVRAGPRRAAPPSWSAPTCSSSPSQACEEAVVLRGRPRRRRRARRRAHRCGDGDARVPGAHRVTRRRPPSCAPCSPCAGRWPRAPGLRFGIVLGARAAVAARCVGQVLGSGDALDAAALGTAVELAPAAFLGFGALALIAPLTAGGGNEVVPPDQLVAYPVRPATQFLGGLVLAPAQPRLGRAAAGRSPR